MNASHTATNTHVQTLSRRAVLDKALEDLFRLLSIIVVPWLQPKTGHKHCPTAVGLDNLPLGGCERGLCYS